MEIVISNGDEINDLSVEEQASIASCVNTISSTPYGSMPYMRDMGLKKLLPRDNSEYAHEEYLSDVTEQLNVWEERIEVTDMSFVDENTVKAVISVVDNQNT